MLWVPFVPPSPDCRSRAAASCLGMSLGKALRPQVTSMAMTKFSLLALPQVCLGMALGTALRGEAVLYIDTSNAFSPQRVAGLFSSLPDNGVSQFHSHLSLQDRQSLSSLWQSLECACASRQRCGLNYFRSNQN